MPIESYQILQRCLGIVHKISRLAEITGISKSTLTHIAKGRGQYTGCLSTQMRLQDFLESNQHRKGRPFKNDDISMREECK